MSDPDPSAEEQQIRRLLADVRHDEPLPDDVADRLDAVLADLGDQSPARRTPPADLAAARRRRRFARNALVAAAAVVLVGFGASRVDLGGQGAADSGSSGAALETRPQADGSGDSSSDAGTSDDSRLWLLKGAPIVLHAADFDDRVRRLAAVHPVTNAPEAPEPQDGYASATGDDTMDYGAARIRCDDSAWGRGHRIAVRYDGHLGALVLRRASGGTRDVDLYLCGESTPTRTTTVPVG